MKTQHASRLPSKETLWIDSLTVLSVILLFFTTRNSPAKTLYYLRSTTNGEFLLGLLGRLRLLMVSGTAVNWNLGDLRDERGRSLRYLVEETTTGAVAVSSKEFKQISDSLGTLGLPQLWTLEYLKNCLFWTFRPLIASRLIVESMVIVWATAQITPSGPMELGSFE